MSRSTPTKFSGLSGIFTGATNVAVPALFFLVPLLFTPFTAEVLEIGKQFVFLALVAIAVLGWLGGMVFRREFSFRGGWVANIVPLAFVVLTALSAIWSKTGAESWLGATSQEYSSVATVAGLVGLYYVLVNGVSAKVGRRSIIALIIAAALAGIVGTLSLFGINPIPVGFVDYAGFNTVGTFNAFTFFMTVVSLLGLGLFLSDDSTQMGSVIPSGAKGWVIKISILLTTVLALLALVAIDYWVAWVTLMVGIAGLFALFFLNPEHFVNPKRFIVPGVMFVTAAIFLFVRSPLTLNIPLVIAPSYGTSMSIATSTLKEGVERALFGSGPGSFTVDFSQYKPVAVNGSQFFAVRFDRSQSHALTLLATVGVLGALAFLAMMIISLLSGVGSILRDTKEMDWKIGYAVFAAWLAVFVVHLLDSSTMTLSFLLFALTGLLVGRAAAHAREIVFTTSPRVGMGVTSAFVLACLACVCVFFPLSGKMFGSVAFAKAIALDRAGGAKPEDIGAQIEKAIKHDGHNAEYYRNLSAVRLTQAGNYLATLKDKPTDDQIKQLSDLAGASVDAAINATNVAPADALNWAVRGSVYRELMPFLQNAEDAAAQSYVNAVNLDPNNPEYVTDLGRVYLMVSDRALEVKNNKDADKTTVDDATKRQTEQLANAENIFNHAIQLKPDYAQAHYYLAAVYERQGKLKEAASRLAAITQIAPTDVGLGFQLGVLYMNMKDEKSAKAEFERILKVFPDYSNAMWYLAKIDVDGGDKDGALKLLGRVKELNPDNKDVDAYIASVKSGQATPAAAPAPVVETGTATPTAPVPGV